MFYQCSFCTPPEICKDQAISVEYKLASRFLYSEVLLGTNLVFRHCRIFLQCISSEGIADVNAAEFLSLWNEMEAWTEVEGKLCQNGETLGLLSQESPFPGHPQLPQMLYPTKKECKLLEDRSDFFLNVYPQNLTLGLASKKDCSLIDLESIHTPQVKNSSSSATLSFYR